MAVVGLHGNAFKPHTGTKTSVLFVQKWDDELCPRVDDYPIFFATMQEQSKDNSGEKIYLKEKDLIEWQMRKRARSKRASPEGEDNLMRKRARSKRGSYPTKTRLLRARFYKVANAGLRWRLRKQRRGRVNS